jgi:hypothetical protein
MKAKIILEKMGIYNKFLRECKKQNENPDEAMTHGIDTLGYAFDWGGTKDGKEFWEEKEEEFQKLYKCS